MKKNIYIAFIYLFGFFTFSCSKDTKDISATAYTENQFKVTNPTDIQKFESLMIQAGIEHNKCMDYVFTTLQNSTNNVTVTGDIPVSANASSVGKADLKGGVSGAVGVGIYSIWFGFPGWVATGATCLISAMIESTVAVLDDSYSVNYPNTFGNSLPEIVSLSEKIIMDFVVSSDFFKENQNAALETTQNYFKNYIKAGSLKDNSNLWFTRDEKNLSVSQKEWLTKINSVIDEKVSLEELVSRLNDIKAQVLIDGTTDDQYVVIAAVEIAKSSFDYWYHNLPKWTQLFHTEGSVKLSEN